MTQIALQTKERASITKELCAQTCINMQPFTRREGIRTKKGYIGTPGLTLFGSTTAGSQVRAIYGDYDNATCYAVVDTALYTIDSAGVRTSRGTIAGTGRALIQLGIDQVFIGRTDVAGGYVYIPSTTTLSAISDPDFLGAVFATNQDTYLIYLPNTTNGRFYLSNAADFTSYNSLQFATEETISDQLLGCISTNRDLWLIGTKSTGVWFDSGATVPFDRRTFIQKGCSARYSIAEYDGIIAFLGDTENGRVGVLAAGIDSSYTLKEITTDDVAYQINSYVTVSDAYAFMYTLAGHPIYQVSFPTQGVTWCFDFMEQEWFQKTDSTGTYHRAFCCTAYNGKILVGDRSSGRIWEMSFAGLDDDGSAITRELITPPVYSDNKWQRINRLQLDQSAGVGNVATATPTWSLFTSKDSGNTYSAARTLNMGAASAYTTRAFSNRFGAARCFNWKIQTTSRARVYISSLSIEMTAGGQ